jgi:hypothetical protein
VRFTAPTTDTYTITGSFRGLQKGATSTEAFLYRNLTGPALLDSLIDSNASVPFTFVLNLAAGETLDFRVDARGNLFGDSTGLAVKVVEGPVTTGTPEPSTFGLAGLAATGLFLCRRSLRRAPLA